MKQIDILLIEMSLSPSPIRLIEGMRHNSRHHWGEPKEGNPKEDNRQGETLWIFFSCCPCL